MKCIKFYDFLFGWVLYHINHCRLFNAKSGLVINIRYIWFVNFESTKFNSTKYCYVSKPKSFVYIQLNGKTVLFQKIQFRISIMVIVVGNGHGDTSSNPDEADCISHSTNTLGKGMNPIILPPAMGK